MELKASSRPQWMGLAAALWVQVAAGSAYSFPLYSPALKTVLGYSQQQLTVLGVANDIGENFGLIAGVACNLFPPWLLLLVGAGCCFVGFGVLYLAVTRTGTGLPFWVTHMIKPSHRRIDPPQRRENREREREREREGGKGERQENVMAGAVKAGSRPPWVGLAAAVWVQVAAGTAYTFPLYSHSLKTALGYSQQQLTFLGVANDTGENFGLVAGVLCNRLPPWFVLLIGAACCFVGFGVLWLAVSLTVPGLPYWLLWIALCIATNSSAWFGTGVLVTNMRNFPLSRGTVAGILKGYVGLSAAVYTGLYTGILHDSSTKLLLFLTIGLPIIAIAMMYFVRPCTPSLEEDSSEHGHFVFTQISSAFLGLYLLSYTVMDDVLPLSDVVIYILFVIMILFLLAPLAIPIKMTLFPTNRKKHVASTSQLPAEGSDHKEPLLSTSSSTNNFGTLQESDDASDVDMLLAEGEGAVKKKRRPKRGDDFEIQEAFIKADFWLLFLVYFLGVGSGVTVLNNLAQIGVAAGVDDTTILLCLFSFCNFVGRLGGGSVSEYFVRSRMLPRPVWMGCTQVVMVVAYLLYASALNGTLYASTAMLGVCYGVQFSVMVPTVSELFGLKQFGMFYNFMLLGNPLGAFFFSGLLAGYVYDNEAAKQGSGSSTCYGPNCFRLTFLVLAGMCTLGTLLSVILSVRIRPVYQMLYAGGSFRLPRSSLH
ncbi:protein NUCLEAR FUSION DEFECTIVE 4 [Canna indica]|uniref:Protein NUCLEAR FUSION DEFECTIVE 4 n=1 Tax=Canna indica TaxID=4628 RepID=A0AAQ3JKP4_9LILI|nr:protein NUCLEAR FUSION DEFECTIVE 4 [Canna indica]